MAYSNEDRERAKEAYERHGATSAARTTGISRAAIKRWAAEGNWKRQHGPALGNGHRSENEPTSSVAPPVVPESVTGKAEGGSSGFIGSFPVGQGQAYLVEAVAMREAAADARRRGKAREAQAYMTSSAIATDKARLLGVKESGASQQLSPVEQARANWSVMAHLLVLFDTWARRDPSMARAYGQAIIDRADLVEQFQERGQEPPALIGWDYAQHAHPDDRVWAERQRQRERLSELLEANGYNYPAAMRKLRAEREGQQREERRGGHRP
jgi:hypothetical protein